MKRHRILRAHRARIAWTNTSQVPDDELVAALRALARELPGALDGYVVHVTGTPRWARGWHYSWRPDATNMDGLVRSEWRGGLIIVRTPNAHHETWVDVLAHEAKHAEQAKSRTLPRLKRERQAHRNALAFDAWFTRRWLAGEYA